MAVSRTLLVAVKDGLLLCVEAAVWELDALVVSELLGVNEAEGLLRALSDSE